MIFRIITSMSLLLILCSCAEKKVIPTEVHDIRGEVIRLVPEDQVAVVKHEDIDGWMKAMTMEFPVKEASEFEKLRPGMKFDAKVYVQDLDYWLAEIKEIQ